MGCDLLRGLRSLRDLFFDTSKPEPLFDKTTKQPFIDVLAPVKKTLELSDNPEWKDLAKRLDIASIQESGHHPYFIYPICRNEQEAKKGIYTEIYVRKSTLRELNQLCRDALEANITSKQKNQFETALLLSSEILNGKTINEGKIELSQASAAETSQKFDFRPL